jgi:hypothetical protein
MPPVSSVAVANPDEAMELIRTKIAEARYMIEDFASQRCFAQVAQFCLPENLLAPVRCVARRGSPRREMTHDHSIATRELSGK